MIKQNDDEIARHVQNVRNERTTEMIDDKQQAAAKKVREQTVTGQQRQTRIRLWKEWRWWWCKIVIVIVIIIEVAMLFVVNKKDSIMETVKILVWYEYKGGRTGLAVDISSK